MNWIGKWKDHRSSWTSNDFTSFCWHASRLLLHLALYVSMLQDDLTFATLN